MLKNLDRVKVVLKNGEDGYILAECPSIPGCRSQGKTRAEAITNIREAAELCLDVRRGEGWPLFEEPHTPIDPRADVIELEL
ncbi:hypothetical protein ATW55_03265 [Ferroacidibacillus organovorans]|uniref:HicB-like antitoxin of toxin-antitoxin system domain-containing protein n=2 Tax=Ferroacidibacillus organovorans TaxID=1765683 RepID=A0A117SY53_9BACL|nr:hypothetical protein ATW55_15375 [Ferroacidibacillus organovorans]KUO96376.1 hypothetical protein ATW55_03265 [Ferroacidibacillus organovorans]